MKTLWMIVWMLPVALAAQDREKEIQLRLGYGLAIYGTELEYNYDDGTIHFTLQDDDSAATSHVPIELRYEFHPRFNAGIDMRFGKYLYDEDEDNSGKSNQFSSFGIGLEGVVVSKPKFRWFIGLSLSTTKLLIKQETLINKETFDWRGGGARLYTGICWFVADGPIGLSFNIGRDSRTFDLKEYTNEGATQDLKNVTGTLKVSGIDFCFGITARLKR
ncbi:MAG: hypothetical protein ACKVOR_05265 [Flavobacteriales bacterium]